MRSNLFSTGVRSPLTGEAAVRETGETGSTFVFCSPRCITLAQVALHCRIHGRYAAPNKPASFPSAAFSIRVSVVRKVNDRRRVSSSMAGANRSHAPSTPPLSRYRGKLKVFTSMASAMPSASPMETKIVLAFSLPASASSYTCFAVSASPRPSNFAIAVTAVADACFSTQPRLPQPQGLPFGTTVMCPSSPAMPRKPRSTFPFETMPPPIPVPRVNSTRSSTSASGADPFLAQRSGVGVVFENDLRPKTPALSRPEWESSRATRGCWNCELHLL